MPSNSSLNAVQKLYISFYGRPADPLGLDFWATQLDNANGVVQNIINAFANSEEYQSRFGSLDDSSLINNLYLQSFGRSAEPAGLEYWLGQISSGAITLGELALVILDGAQGNDLSVINNKRALADQITFSLESLGKSYGLEQIPLAKSLLDTVTANTDINAINLAELLNDFPSALPSTPAENDLFTQFDANEFQQWIAYFKAMAENGTIQGLSASPEEVVAIVNQFVGYDLDEIFAELSPDLLSYSDGTMSYAVLFDAMITWSGYLFQILEPQPMPGDSSAFVLTEAHEPLSTEIILVGSHAGVNGLFSDDIM
ncbi:DUF4214 domain-containing protein [Nitrincola alkalilacustris]|uniref:DUF4214 domain-containing protein n=1 Tax=Nitrincola alkalilacustris TaxID=1571224 RepID=UPI0014576CAE|nr:DUF4214 domain-containing protein [Nitrincola alkalilacustris]